MPNQRTFENRRLVDANQGHIALLIDWENFKGATTDHLGSPPDIITLKKIARQYGTLSVARAYANWADVWHEGDMERLAQQGVEPVFTLTRPRLTDEAIPNSADVRLACDGMELLASHPGLTCFVIVSGDGSLAHLVRHLQAHAKQTVRIATWKSLSKLHYVPGEQQVFYEEWVEGLKQARNTKAINESMEQLVTAVAAVQRESGQPNLKAIKERIRSDAPSFEEERLGVPSFRHLAYLAEDKGQICIDASGEPARAFPHHAVDQRAGLYKGATWSGFIRRVRGIELQEAERDWTKGGRTGLNYSTLLEVAQALKDPPADPKAFIRTACESQILWSRSFAKYFDPKQAVAQKRAVYLLNLHHPRVQVALIKGPIAPNEAPLRRPDRGQKTQKPTTTG